MTKNEQMGFDFGEAKLEGVDDTRLNEAFLGFFKMHPEVWKFFSIATLIAIDEGAVPIRPHRIMSIVRSKTAIPVDYRFIPLYADLFTSAHQELSWVFKR